MTHRPLAPTLLAAALLGAPRAHAQQPAGVVAGTVVSATGAPLRSVDVSVDGGARAARTDSAGRFAVAGLAPGAHRVTVRALGFEALDVTARVAAGDTARLALTLRPAVAQLTTVRVEERTATGIAAFDARRASGQGRYFDPEVLQAARGRQLSELLNGVPGVRLVPQENGGVAVASRRGQSSMTASGGQCFMAVYIDGVRVYEPTVADDPNAGASRTTRMVVPGASEGRASSPAPRDTKPPVNINTFDPSLLAGVEVYSGPAQLPAELRGTGTGCGAVFLWTQRR